MMKERKISSMGSLKLVADKIKSRDNFLILGHIDPDGDCIGSMFALKWMLDQLKKKSLVLLHEIPGDQYDYFFENKNEIQDQNQEFYLLENFLEKKIISTTKNENTVIALDAGDKERLGKGKKLLKRNFSINIDHHPDNSGYGDLNFIDSERAAVGEILYYLSSELGVNIGKQIGKALATAVITDTGSLQYENTSAEVLRMMAELMDKEVDLYQINRKMFGNFSFNSVKLKGMALSNLNKSEDGKISWLYVNQEMMKKTDSDIKATSGFVNYPRDIKGVEVGIAFFEKEKQEIEVSLRSNAYVPVNKIASVFKGGGHARAAGCTIEKELQETINMVIKEVKKFV